MKKFIVETYYTCTFKTVHTLNNLNDQELAKIDSRNDGEVEVIDVKLNNRKTKTINKNDFKKPIAKPSINSISEIKSSVSDKINDLQEYKNIGITSGASAPEKLVFDLINEIKKNAEVEVKEIEIAKENVSFKLPKILN